MADNTTLLLVVGYILTYAIIYNKNKLYGSILITLLGVLSILVSDTYIGAALAFIGIMILYFNANEILQNIFTRKQNKAEWYCC